MVWISGQVDSVDWVGNRFSIQTNGGYSGFYSGVYQNMPQGLRFFVNRDTQFVQQTQRLGFSALEQSDNVSVLFCVDSFVDPVAVRVVINNSYPKS